MATSQSDTKWFKKGSKLPDGTIAKKSLVWNTKTGKRQQGAVSISATSGSVKKGTTVRYKAGSNRGAVKKKPAAKGAGVMPGKPKAAPKRAATPSRPTSVKRTSPARPAAKPKAKATPKATPKAKARTQAARPGEYQAGRGQTARRPSSATPSHYTGSSVNKPGGPRRGNGSPASKIRNSVIDAFRGRGGKTVKGSGRNTKNMPRSKKK